MRLFLTLVVAMMMFSSAVYAETTRNAVFPASSNFKGYRQDYTSASVSNEKFTGTRQGCIDPKTLSPQNENIPSLPPRVPQWADFNFNDNQDCDSARVSYRFDGGGKACIEIREPHPDDTIDHSFQYKPLKPGVKFSF